MFRIACPKTHARIHPLRRGNCAGLLDILPAIVDPKDLTAKTLRKE